MTGQMEQPRQQEIQPHKSDGIRTAFGAMGVYGGVQAVQILAGLIRGKVSAVFLGAFGMGVSSLYSSAVAVVQQIAVAGINLAVVKEVAAVADDDEARRLAASVSSRLTGICALAGGVLCLLLSPLLSRLTFGNYDYTVGFMALSAMVAFSVGAAGQQALLQATRSLRPLARATMCGVVMSLLVAVPLYWVFSVEGIVPAMIAGSFFGWLFYRRAVSRAGVCASSAPRLRDNMPIVRSLLRGGVSLMAVGAISVGVTFAVNVFLRASGGESAVAMYQAASSVSAQCASLVFTAMAMDYFPRISAMTSDREALSDVAGGQQSVVLIVLTPIACMLSLAAPLVADLLFSREFIAMVPLLRWLAVAMTLKGVSYPLGYVPLAMGRRRLYFWLEGVYGALTVFAGVSVGYILGALEGIGIALCAVYLLDIAVYAAVCVRCFGVVIRRRVAAEAVVSVVMVMSVTLAAGILENAVAYAVMALLTFTALTISWIRFKKVYKANGDN